MIERMELGEFYKELRLARKLKQSDVACAGLTASQLSKFELDLRHPVMRLVSPS